MPSNEVSANIKIYQGDMTSERIAFVQVCVYFGTFILFHLLFILPHPHLMEMLKDKRSYSKQRTKENTN